MGRRGRKQIYCCKTSLPTSEMCPECAERKREKRRNYIREYQAVRREVAREEGICPVCCTYPSESGKTLCSKCSHTAAKYAARKSAPKRIAFAVKALRAAAQHLPNADELRRHADELEAIQRASTVLPIPPSATSRDQGEKSCL